ncbi:MAG: EAL domain-containing protein [Filomicrobium sp.]
MDEQRREQGAFWLRADRACLRIALCFAAALFGFFMQLSPAQAVDPIVVNPRADVIEITSRGEIWDNRGDSLQVETAAGLDGVVGRMDVKALTPGTNPNWIVFALTNRTERHIERWLTADRYNSVGSGAVWPDLDASRISAVTPSIGFVPERVKSDRADVFRITLEPGQTITFVGELSSERFSRIFLWKPLAYELKVRERQLLNGTLLGLTGLMAIFLTAIFAANHKAIFPTAALVAWCVLVYLCIDFGFFHKLFNLRPEDNAVYRAAGEASIAASLVIFLFTFLRLGLSHGLVRMLFGVWILAQLALIAVAVVDPRLSATFARLSFLLIGGAGALLVLFLALRGQDRAMSIIPTWILFLVWIFATAVTLTGRMSGDIVVGGLAAGLVLVVVLLGFTVTQFAFRSLEPTYGAAPNEQQLRSLAVDGVGAATWEWSARRDEIKVGPILEAQLGLNHGELCTKVDDFLEYVQEGDRDRFRLVLWSIKERAGGRIRLEFRMRHADNTYRWYELEAASVENAEHRNVRCVGLMRDITDTKRTHERLLQDAVNCRVTALPNREIFIDRLEVASQRAKSEDNIRPTVIFIDLDRFRSVNANLGPVVGDSLLVTTARRLKRHLGDNDTLARIAGDQFAILLLNQQDPRELATLAETIRRSLRTPIKIAGQDVVLTGSLGLAVYDGDESSSDALLKHAEIAMYRAKRKGADRIELFQPAMLTHTGSSVSEELELRKAVDNGQLSILFQPIVYLPTEELAGFEAVLSWKRAKQKPASHTAIMEIAERSDLIRKVSGFLLTNALETAKTWQSMLPRFEAPLFVSVNLSNRQMFRPEVVEEWRQIIRRHIVPAESIRLEVGEQHAMDNPERAVEMMRVLGAAGSELVIDEFGEGYSSVSYLQRFPAGTIKVNTSIVQAGTTGEGDGDAVIRSVASMAHELGKRVLGEGVEIEDDVIFLRAIGCEYGQGLYYGEPMAEQDVADLVRLIAKSEKKLEAPGLFRTRPKKSKKKKAPQDIAAVPTADMEPAEDLAIAAAATGNGAGVLGRQGESVNGTGQASRPPPPIQKEQGIGLPGNGPEQANDRVSAGPGRPVPPPQPASPVPPQAKPRVERPTAEDVFKDAKRAIASLPNVTVRPMDQKLSDAGAAGRPSPVPPPPQPSRSPPPAGVAPTKPAMPPVPPVSHASSGAPPSPQASANKTSVRPPPAPSELPTGTLASGSDNKTGNKDAVVAKGPPPVSDIFPTEENSLSATPPPTLGASRGEAKVPTPPAMVASGATNANGGAKSGSLGDQISAIRTGAPPSDTPEPPKSIAAVPPPPIAQPRRADAPPVPPVQARQLEEPAEVTQPLRSRRPSPARNGANGTPPPGSTNAAVGGSGRGSAEGADKDPYGHLPPGIAASLARLAGKAKAKEGGQTGGSADAGPAMQRAARPAPRGRRPLPANGPDKRGNS